MTKLPSSQAWRSPSLALQIAGLLLGALVIAQLTTLLLVFFLPPQPPEKYGLRDIAGALHGENPAGSSFDRGLRAAPPQLDGRGWLVSDSSRDELARMLGVSASDVRLSFYTPLPFAGTIGGIVPPPPAASPAANAYRKPMASDGPAYRQSAFRTWQDRSTTLDQDVGRGRARTIPASYLIFVQASPGAGMPGGPPVGLPGGGFPRGGFPGSGFPGGGFPRHNFPGAGLPHGGFPGSTRTPTPPGSSIPAGTPAATATPGQGPATASEPSGTRPGTIVSPQNEARPPETSGPSAVTGMPESAMRPSLGGAMPQAGFRALFGPQSVLPPPFPSDIPAVRPPDAANVQPEAERHRRPVTEPKPDAGVTPAPQVIAPVVPQMEAPAVVPQPTAPAILTQAPDRPVATPEKAPSLAPRTGLQGAIDKARGLFGLSPSPYVEGDFVAALRQPDGQWVVVQPAHDAILSPWQKRVALWFVISFAIVAPVGWLFARRLSLPLQRFADAASQLGRDPSAAIAALDGPAEIGRAAHAFNLMQQRLRSFVDDRTAMVGAISHDLRTPLTRMRFRIEDAPDDIREGLRHEVDEMEEMITSVLAFIRDASTPGVREKLDLRDLLEDVSEDAAVTGAAVPIAADVPATVEVDVLGMRRVLVNLVENALKYGRHARMELSVLGDEAVAAVIDDGPGLPDDELEQVFQPFYRTASARASTAPGTGLGLAVCRSIARAHGGDVHLSRTPQGFRAEVRVPLAYEAARAMAA